MAIQLQQLPEKVKESIENLATLMEIGTGSDTQNEYITDAVKAIAWMMDNVVIAKPLITKHIITCHNKNCELFRDGYCINEKGKCDRYVLPVHYLL